MYLSMQVPCLCLLQPYVKHCRQTTDCTESGTPPKQQISGISHHPVLNVYHLWMILRKVSKLGRANCACVGRVCYVHSGCKVWPDDFMYTIYTRCILTISTVTLILDPLPFHCNIIAWIKSVVLMFIVILTSM